MKFLILVTGMVLGFVIADNTSAQQRAKVRSMARRARAGRTATVAETVGSGIGDIADAATDRVTSAVDHATSTVVDRVAEPTG